jgi:hypothetical protein
MRADLELGKGEREMLSRLEPEAIVRKILSYETKEEVFAFLGATYLPIKTTFLVLQDLRKCGAQHRCLEVAHWAREVDLPLKNIHYTVLLGACRDLKDAKQAEMLLYEMGDRKEANIINYNAFFAVCAAVCLSFNNNNNDNKNKRAGQLNTCKYLYTSKNPFGAPQPR